MIHLILDYNVHPAFAEVGDWRLLPQSTTRGVLHRHKGDAKMGRRRKWGYRRQWNKLVKVYGPMCYYCGEFATVIDHVIPVAAGGTNDFTNLLPCCALCNLIALDREFKDAEEKGDYIRQQRRKMKKMTRAICIDCLLPFQYRKHHRSLFLCPECYDKDFGTEKAKKESWQKWVKLLVTAGYDLEAHRKTARVVRARGKVRQEEKYRILWNFFLGELSDEK